MPPAATTPEPAQSKQWIAMAGGAAVLLAVVLVVLFSKDDDTTKASRAETANNDETTTAPAPAQPLVATPAPTAPASPEPAAAASAGQARKTDYEPSRYDAIAAIPENVLKVHLMGQLASMSVTKFSELWGKKPSEIALLGAAKLLEVEDTRRWLKVYEMVPGMKDRKKKKLTIRWGFIEDQLYFIRLRFRTKSPSFAKKGAIAIGRPADLVRTTRHKVSERDWHEGNLTLTVAKKKKNTALQISDRGFYEVAFKRLQDVKEAEILVAANARCFFSRTSNVHKALSVNQQAVELVDNYGDAWVNLCHANYNSGNHSLATEQCNKALEVTQEESVKGEAHYFLGLIAAARRDKTTALHHLRIARQKVPRSWPIARGMKHRISGLQGSCGTRCGRKALFEQLCANVTSHKDGMNRRNAYIALEYGYRSQNRLFKQFSPDEHWEVNEKIDAGKQCYL